MVSSTKPLPAHRPWSGGSRLNWLPLLAVRWSKWSRPWNERCSPARPWTRSPATSGMARPAASARRGAVCAVGRTDRLLPAAFFCLPAARVPPCRAIEGGGGRARPRGRSPRRRPPASRRPAAPRTARRPGRARTPGPAAGPRTPRTRARPRGRRGTASPGAAAGRTPRRPVPAPPSEDHPWRRRSRDRSRSGRMRSRHHLLCGAGGVAPPERIHGCSVAYGRMGAWTWVATSSRYSARAWGQELLAAADLPGVAAGLGLVEGIVCGDEPAVGVQPQEVVGGGGRRGGDGVLRHAGAPLARQVGALVGDEQG